jgi:hypothetical protein
MTQTRSMSCGNVALPRAGDRPRSRWPT